MQPNSDPRSLPIQLGWHEIPPEVRVWCVHCRRRIEAGEQALGALDGTWCADCQRDVLGWPVP